MSRRRTTLRWAAAAAAAAVLAAVGGPWVYLNLIEGEAPAALTPSSAASGAPTSGLVAGTWKVGAGSQAGYRVADVLAGQDTEAVDRTDDVTGSTATGTQVTAGSFTVDLTAVTSDSDRRDGRFTGDIMDTAAHPTATFTLTDAFDLGPIADAAGTTSVTTRGDLQLRGVTRPVRAELTAVRSGDGVQVTGAIAIRFADFGIDDPSVGGFVTVGDTGIIDVQLALTRA